jgi:hypothetical protein
MLDYSERKLFSFACEDNYTKHTYCISYET